jgi:3-oxoacyl-[acyl-carrier-protein] synthase II
VPNEGRAAAVDVAISNSFGFGGHNAVLVMRRWQEGD